MTWGSVWCAHPDRKQPLPPSLRVRPRQTLSDPSNINNVLKTAICSRSNSLHLFCGIGIAFTPCHEYSPISHVAQTRTDKPERLALINGVTDFVFMPGNH